MSYTAEQLAGMSDFQINKAMITHTGSTLMETYPHNADGASVYCDYYSVNGTWINFCRDWSVTGPLMVGYGVSVNYCNGKFRYADITHVTPGGYVDVTSESKNQNPLRAICEVILMMAE